MESQAVSAQEPPSLGDEPAPRTLAEAVYFALRDDILWERLSPGSPLRSDALRRRYGFGVSPLREALTRLVADGLVTVIGQRGFKVAPLDPAEVIEVTRLRTLLDGDALRKAIALGGTQWEAGIVAALHTLMRTPTPVEAGPGARAWARAHYRLHQALIDVGASAWSRRLSEMLYYQAERYRIVHARAAPSGRRDTGVEHSDIVEAALARQADVAVAALGRHFQRTATLVLAHLSQTSERKDPP